MFYTAVLNEETECPMKIEHRSFWEISLVRVGEDCYIIPSLNRLYRRVEIADRVVESGISRLEWGRSSIG